MKTESKPRILVIDDDKSWQGLYREELEDVGFDVTVVGTKIDAERAIARRMYHVAVVDVRLDDKDVNNVDGLQILEKIWMLDEGTEAILVTGYAADMLRQFREFQMFGFQKKSLITPEDLLKESRSAAFLKSYFSKEDGLTAIVKEVQRVVANALTNSSRKKWATSPFAPIKGFSQLEIQRKLMSGQMLELRPFLGELCRPFHPWLKSVKEASILEVDQKLAGFEFSIWSRAFGKPLVIRFGRKEHEDKIFEDKSGILKVDHMGTVHYIGAVFESDINFENNFEPPVAKRISSAVFLS